MTDILTLHRSNAELVGEATGTGPDTLLLHAGGETRGVWSPIISKLSKRGYRATAFDQRGHGESGGAPSDGLIAYGQDAMAMIDLLHKPVVVGGSLGGMALMMALEHRQEQVAGLVLVDVTPSPDADLARGYLSPRGNLGASPIVEDILSRADQLSKIVGALKLPIMLVCGGKKSPIDEDARARFSDLVPDARIEVIQQASHLVARDAPSELAQLVADFMDGEEVRARR